MSLLDEFRARMSRTADREWPITVTVGAPAGTASVGAVLDRIRTAVAEVAPDATVSHTSDVADPAVTPHAALVGRTPVPADFLDRSGPWLDRLIDALCDAGLADNDATTSRHDPDTSTYEFVILLEHFSGTADRVREIFAAHEPLVADASWEGFVELPDGSRSPLPQH